MILKRRISTFLISRKEIEEKKTIQIVRNTAFFYWVTKLIPWLHPPTFTRKNLLSESPFVDSNRLAPSPNLFSVTCQERARSYDALVKITSYINIYIYTFSKLLRILQLNSGSVPMNPIINVCEVYRRDTVLNKR